MKLFDRFRVSDEREADSAPIERRLDEIEARQALLEARVAVHEARVHGDPERGKR